MRPKKHTRSGSVVPCYIITSYLAGDYIEELRNIIAPAALMVRQQSSLINTPEWEYSSSQIGLENSHFPSVLVHDVTTEESSFK